MNKTLYIIFMLLLLLAFVAGTYISLQAGETWLKTLVRSTPVFLTMLVFYYLRKIDIKQENVKKNSQENNSNSSDENE